MKSKRILSLVLALVMVLGTFGTVFAQDEAEPATNVKIDWLVDNGIVEGNEAGDLMLDKAIDRASVAKMVVYALDQEQVAAAVQGQKGVFPDVPVTNWSNGNINVVSAAGLMVGNAKGEFMPTSEISYAEVITVMVRMIEGEPANAVWPVTHIARAQALGVLDGVELPADFMENAVREDILEMFYNVMTNKEIGNYSVIKAIVLENYRVETLNKDEIVVEIIEEVQRANFTDDSRDKKGDQVKYVLDAKIGDVEALLGKVANFTINKDNKVVKVEVDNTYDYLTGDYKATKNKLGKYTVELDERYKDSDERIFRTYFNNEPVSYLDFYQDPTTTVREDDFSVDYARITVKNGKVLFVDSFNFEDIAPVKEVKGDGAEVYVYNDYRDGAVKRYDVKASEDILLVQFGKISVGLREDIQVNDVIHEYDGGFVIRKDTAVTGRFEKVSEDRNGDVFVHIDDEEFLVGTEDYKRPVYSFDSKDQFFTLYANTAANDLREFRGETSTVLLDLNDNVQFVGSEIELGEFVGLVTRVVGKDVRVLRTDKKEHDYTANLDTEVDGTTGHRSLNDLKAGDLVFMSVDGKDIREIHNFTETSYDVSALTTRQIDFTNGDDYRILSETNIFVSQNGVYQVKTAKEVADAFAKNSDVEAYVVNGTEFGNVTRRPNLAPRANEAHTIVFTKIEIERSADKEIVEFNGYADSQETLMRIILADGKRETRKIDKDIPKATLDALEGGDIIEIQVTKDDDKDILRITPLIKNNKQDVWGVRDYTNRNNLVVVDAQGNPDTLYVTSDTEVFRYGKDLLGAKRVKVAFEPGSSKYLKAVLIMDDRDDITANPSGVPTTDGIVTYINPDRTSFVVDGNVLYPININTVLRNATGIIATGFDVATVLKEGDTVEVKDNVVTIKGTLDEAQTAAYNKAIARWNQLVAKNFDTTAMTVNDAATLGTAKAAVATITAPTLTDAELDLAAAKGHTKALHKAAEANLTTTIANIAAYEEAVAVEKMITDLPATITLADKTAVVAARAAFNGLTTAQRALVTNEADLITAENTIADIEAVATAKAALTTLAFDATLNEINVTPRILGPVPHSNGATYSFSNLTLPSPLPTGANASIGGLGNVNIVRANSVDFSFELEVTVTVGVETDTKVFLVNVPTTLTPVTVVAQ